MKKRIILGGGTVTHTAAHTALAAVAYGDVVRDLKCLLESRTDMEIHSYLTRMADASSKNLETPEDLALLAAGISDDLRNKIVFWAPAVVDHKLVVGYRRPQKYADRLGSAEYYRAELVPRKTKIIGTIREGRKDIFLVGFKTTCGATEDQQYIAALEMLKRNSCNLVLANDVKTRTNMIVCPEEARYSVTTNRLAALLALVEMTLLRSNLTFTRSTVVAGDPVPWTEAPAALQRVVNHCVDKGAYKAFLGATAGHFACKLSDTEFLTSRRKTDLSKIAEVGLVRVVTDGPDTVIAYGSKPSVGGQSRRIVFNDHEGYDSIVHFHCPIRPDSKVPVVSQREYECGSHQCGKNTSDGLAQFGRLKAVYLYNHGPNILFDSKDAGIAEEAIEFIERNFFLHQKTGGPVSI